MRLSTDPMLTTGLPYQASISQSDIPQRFSRTSEHLVLRGRKEALQKIITAIESDIDLLIAGPPGSGRDFLVQVAARQNLLFEIDCLQATNPIGFIELLFTAIHLSGLLQEDLQTREILRSWLSEQSSAGYILTDTGELCWLTNYQPDSLDSELETLLKFIQRLAEIKDNRALLVFKNFTHIRAWGPEEVWELRLRQQINELSRVLYILVGTIGELKDDERRLFSPSRDQKDQEISSLRKSLQHSFETVELFPLEDDIITSFADAELSNAGLRFDPLDNGLDRFLKTVLGSFGDAVMLINRLVYLHAPQLREKSDEHVLLGVKDVEDATVSLIADLNIMCETLLLMLPSKQAKLLTCLALDPTDKPHSRKYIEKHNLYKGGAIQGALSGLQQKGLIYDASQNYRLTHPLLSLWIQQRNNPRRVTQH